MSIHLRPEMAFPWYFSGLVKVSVAKNPMSLVPTSCRGFPFKDICQAVLNTLPKKQRTKFSKNAVVRRIVQFMSLSLLRSMRCLSMLCLIKCRIRVGLLLDASPPRSTELYTNILTPCLRDSSTKALPWFSSVSLLIAA